MACEYCEEGKKNYLFDYRDEVAVLMDFDNELWVTWDGDCCHDIYIRFCPMCGRDLRGDDK